MAKKWREYVYREFMEVDNDFVTQLPFKSINSATFGLITEATTFAPIQINESVHLKSITKGLGELKQALKDSPDPSGNFSLEDARKCLDSFAQQWEELIKKRGKWEKMVEIARSNGEILSEDAIESPPRKKSLFSSFFDLFR